MIDMHNKESQNILEERGRAICVDMKIYPGCIKIKNKSLSWRTI